MLRSAWRCFMARGTQFKQSDPGISPQLQSRRLRKGSITAMPTVSKINARRDLLEPASPFRPFPLEEYEERWRRTYEHMKKLGYETAVVWGKTSGVYERAGDMLY